jgi:hypothetical protein
MRERVASAAQLCRRHNPVRELPSNECRKHDLREAPPEATVCVGRHA